MIETLRRLLYGLIPDGGIAEQTVKSGIWKAGLNVGDRMLQLLLIVVVARLVGPDAIGLMGIALLGLSTARRFSQLGLTQALIHHRSEDVDRYLDTTLTLQVLRGIVLAGILAAAAPTIAAFLGEPRATDLLRAVGVVPILLGLRNPAIVYFRKHLEFHRQFAYRLSGSVVQFAVGVGYALISPTVWALVVAVLAARVTELVASYSVHEFRPGIGFDPAAARELLGYGKWISLGGIAYFLHSEGDDAVVAWVLNAASLGFYQVAYRLAMAPATELSKVVGDVTFPAYARLQDDAAVLRRAFHRTLQVTGLVAIPAAVGLAAVAPTLVRALFGDAWLEMVPVVRILAVYGLARSVTSTFGPVWKAVGRPDLGTKLSGVQVIMLAIVVVPATATYGIVGTAAAVVGVAVVPMLPLDCYYLVTEIDTTIRRFLRTITPALVASSVMAAVVLWTQRSVNLTPMLLELATLVVLGVGVYAVGVYVLDAAFDVGIRGNVRSIIRAVMG